MFSPVPHPPSGLWGGCLFLSVLKVSSRLQTFSPTCFVTHVSLTLDVFTAALLSSAPDQAILIPQAPLNLRLPQGLQKSPLHWACLNQFMNLTVSRGIYVSNGARK